MMCTIHIQSVSLKTRLFKEYVRLAFCFLRQSSEFYMDFDTTIQRETLFPFEHDVLYGREIYEPYHYEHRLKWPLYPRPLVIIACLCLASVMLNLILVFRTFPHCPTSSAQEPIPCSRPSVPLDLNRLMNHSKAALALIRRWYLTPLPTTGILRTIHFQIKSGTLWIPAPLLSLFRAAQQHCLPTI